jgi:hypothetical protein
MQSDGVYCQARKASDGLVELWNCETTELHQSAVFPVEVTTW